MFKNILSILSWPQYAATCAIVNPDSAKIAGQPSCPLGPARRSSSGLHPALHALSNIHSNLIGAASADTSCAISLDVWTSFRNLSHRDWTPLTSPNLIEKINLFFRLSCTIGSSCKGRNKGGTRRESRRGCISACMDLDVRVKAIRPTLCAALFLEMGTSCSGLGRLPR